MKVYKDCDKVLRITNCKECPFTAPVMSLQDAPDDVRDYFPTEVLFEKACMNIKRDMQKMPAGSLYPHPSIEEAEIFGGFLPDCPLEDAPEVKNEVV